MNTWHPRKAKAAFVQNGGMENPSAQLTGTHEGGRLSAQAMTTRFGVRWSSSVAQVSMVLTESLLLVWDFKGTVLKNNTAFPSSRPSYQAKHNCQTVSSVKTRHLGHLTAGNPGEVGNGVQGAVVAESGLFPAFHCKAVQQRRRSAHSFIHHRSETWHIHWTFTPAR